MPRKHPAFLKAAEAFKIFSLSPALFLAFARGGFLAAVFFALPAAESLPGGEGPAKAPPPAAPFSPSRGGEQKDPPPAFDYPAFSRLPILHGGRIKPLQTFAREHLRLFSGRARLPEASAESWLAETLFHPPRARGRPLFKIRNPELRDSLGLRPKSPGKARELFSFYELSRALDKDLESLRLIRKKPPAERGLLESQKLALYEKAQLYFQLSRSLSLILPVFSVEDPAAAKKAGLAPGKKYRYTELLARLPKIKAAAPRPAPDKNLSKGELELLALLLRMGRAAQDESNDWLRIIPPLWRDSPELWRSPWNLLKTGRGNPASAESFARWMDMERAYRTGAGGREASAAAFQSVMALSKGFARPAALFLEKGMNDWGLFQKSLWLYLLSLALWLFSGAFWRRRLLKLSFLSLGLGASLHFAGVLLRVLIMARPPVATLYESVLFVGLLSAGAGLFLSRGAAPRALRAGRGPRRLFRLPARFLYIGRRRGPGSSELRLPRQEAEAPAQSEKPGAFKKPPSAAKAESPLWERRGGPGLPFGAFSAAALQLLAFRHEGAESMEALAPVLRANFWLASHVLSVTAGYAAALAAGGLAHIYIFLRLRRPAPAAKKSLAPIYKSLSSASFLALFFCLFGTILGGIWADQSWGRFWGWDPKENGALFLILWLLALLHGRMGGVFKEDGFALGHILTNAAVALSWFGVNLLGEGLHSYGFMSGAAWGLGLFCAGEAGLFLLGFFWLKRSAARAGKKQ